MATEIERKFLVHVDRLPQLDRGRAESIEQGYLSFQPSVRVRRSRSGTSTHAWITVKGPGTFARSEFEYEIPSADADALLALCVARLTKVRHHPQAGAHTWDLDEFTGAHSGLWLAEVELTRVDEPFARPDWLDREVTDDPRYANGALARAGRAP